MHIGINASFLRKPGTGIGQVTLYFIKTLSELPEAKKHTFSLYLDQEIDTGRWPENFAQKVFLPWWKRDDVPRKLLWEKKLATFAQRDGCEAFVSLYQVATVFPSGFNHVMVVHDIIPFLFPGYLDTLARRLYGRAVKRGIHQATSLVSVSQATKHDLEKFGIAEKKITVAHQGLAPSFREPLSEAEVAKVLKKFHLSPGYLYHGGGLEKRKNAEGVLRAYARLLHELGESVPPLVISGKIFSETNTLATPIRSLLRELGLEKRVILTDFLDEKEIHALYQGALFFIYPSFYEGFGLPVIEALACGTPVITSENSSLPEVGGSAALFINPENIAALTAAMKKLVTDAHLREELISKSRAQALQFDWQTFTRCVLSRVSHSL